jgi:hypothetical protein
MYYVCMLINACIRLNYVPDAWKTAEVIMIPKPGKNLSEEESYRSILLLPIMSKRLKHVVAEKHLVPTHVWFQKKSFDNRPGASYHRLH